MPSVEYESSEVCMMKGGYPDREKGPRENRSSTSKPNTLDIVGVLVIDIENNNVGKDTSSYQHSDKDKDHGVNNRTVIPLGSFTNYLCIFCHFLTNHVPCTNTVVEIAFFCLPTHP